MWLLTLLLIEGAVVVIDQCPLEFRGEQASEAGHRLERPLRAGRARHIEGDRQARRRGRIDGACNETGAVARAEVEQRAPRVIVQHEAPMFAGAA